MKLEKIWEALTPNPDTIENLKKDMAEGKTPELPYFIVDQQNVKDAVYNKLVNIDGSRMQTNVILGLYGNGKTNLLKYLQLYFKNNDKGIKTIYTRTDVEQPDLILFLLKLLQSHCLDDLINSIRKLKVENYDIKKLANNYEDNFSEIKEYVEKIFSDDFKEEDIKKMIFLGTGRLYTIGHFATFKLNTLTNFNRREILVFFLNVLSKSKIYIIFSIDEVEKIEEKSKIRFNQFLTSYRELIDLFNKIEGHYIISCFTDIRGKQKIEEINSAFYTRVSPDISELYSIVEYDDILILLKYLNLLFNAKKTEDELRKITTQLKRDSNIRDNRELMRRASENLLKKITKFSLNELLNSGKIEVEFSSAKRKNDSRRYIEINSSKIL